MIEHGVAFCDKILEGGTCDRTSCRDCEFWKRDHAISNGDVFRSMNNHDLADWIARVLTYHGSVVADEYHVDCNTDCPLYKCCNDQPTDNIEGWLDLPAEVVT